MRTVIIVYDQAFLSGGAAKIAIGEAVGLKKAGWRVILFSGIAPVSSDLTENEVEVICLNEKHIGLTKDPKALLKGIWNTNSRKQLEILLESLSPKETIVHVHGWTKSLSSSIFLATYKKKFKTLITLHEYFTICGNGGLFDYKRNEICRRKPGGISCVLCNCDKRNYFHKIYRNVRQIVQNLTLRLTKPGVIYITCFSEKHLSNLHFNVSNKYKLTNFVDITKRSRIASEQNSDYVFIGRVSQEKGIELFCDAVTYASVKGVVIGDGPMLNQCKDRYPQVEFVGWKSPDEMKAFIEKARCLIITSKWYETMGLTVIEMQQYGIPCIVPYECAPSEYIENEKNGFTYKIGDKESLYEAIIKTKDNIVIEKISRDFYNNLNYDFYSIDTHIKKLSEIYNEELNSVVRI